MRKHLLFIILLITNLNMAADVYLKSGKVWTNVTILKELETDYSITIESTGNERTSLSKGQIIGIADKQIDPEKSSELKFFTDDQLKELDEKWAWKYLANSRVPANSTPGNHYSPLANQPNFMIKIEGGYSYRLADIEDDYSGYEGYINELKNGFNISTSLTYFFTGSYGIELNYTRFSSSSSKDNIYFVDPQTNDLFMGSMEDKITFTFIGAGIVRRALFPNRKFQWHSGLSAGYVLYNNDARMAYLPLNIEGSTFGLRAFGEIDYSVQENLSLCATISVLYGSMGEIKVNGVKVSLDQRESTSRIDINIGLKYLFN